MLLKLKDWWPFPAIVLVGGIFVLVCGSYVGRCEAECKAKGGVYIVREHLCIDKKVVFP